ncbi:MAG: bifunctional adenosylcobinamide kinase/adenosylcobinamide-phosphate guanylyltransferase [Anaerovoracaceae bacterium]|nr:bifunctional adenosylcobinamide kinase/adenosylcobinamide-phosphate guanylyltransferase [Bacillota bacterium]MDY2670900.1 bifunctional adenosylcobinamide kinase/adenosylcobinamide-phosphate guanylyltransferase [Anaerovoracaceae bacterium]
MRLFVTGGSASGKSEYAGRSAEALAGDRPVLYIATLADRSEESRKRVARHEALRRDGAADYDVAECFSLADLEELGGRRPVRFPYGAVLFDSIDGFTADVMFGMAPDFSGPEDFQPDSYAERSAGAILEISSLLAEHAVFVIDDIFRDGGRYDKFTRDYMRYTALTGRRIAEKCGLAAEVVCGVAVPLKGETDEFPEIDSYNAVALH